VVTQLSLLAEVPVKHVVQRRPPTGPTPTERILVDLAPFLPAESTPRHHKGCVEIALSKGHALERTLRKLGFRPSARPFDWVRPKRPKGAPAQVEVQAPATVQRFWRLEVSR
jgi:hypothetical protein